MIGLPWARQSPDGKNRVKSGCIASREEMLQELQTTPSPESDQQRSDSPPTRVMVKQVEARTTVEAILDGPAELADFQQTDHARAALYHQ